MTASHRGLSPDRLARLDAVLAGHVGADRVPGAVWAVARGDEVHVGLAGTMDVTTGRPVARDSVFRLSSMTKPLAAVAALILLEECRLRLDEPVDPFLPELADRRVLVRPDGRLDDTVPAQRPISVRDVLTFRLGLGMDFTASSQPVLEELSRMGVVSAPPAPGRAPAPDEWMQALGQVPLEHQPGERWRYHLGADVLGVLVARVAGQPFDVFLRERIFDPLGMVDTGFWVPPAARDRFGPVYGEPDGAGGASVYDPTDGQWASPPAFPAGGDGLVSTIDDYLAFAAMLRGGGRAPGGPRLLARPSVEVMTTNQLTPEQVALIGGQGWGFGVGVLLERLGPTPSVGSYGWEGGLGSSWSNDPVEDLTGVLLTNRMWLSPTPPAIRDDFWTCAYGAIDD